MADVILYILLCSCIVITVMTPTDIESSLRVKLLHCEIPIWTGD